VGIRVGAKDAAAARGRDGREPWFVPPRLLTTQEVGERHATWLELFFDLVFVVAVTQLSHELVLRHSARGFLVFAALFVPVWVAWQGYTFYATRFDTDDLAFRAAYFAAMLAIAAMAVLIGDVAHGEHTTGFAVAYVCLRSFMLGLYWRAWRAVPEARPLVGLYGGGYTLGVAIWLASLAFAPPARYVVWAVAQAVELSLPPLATRIHRRVPTSGSHVPERWALFTLIVLGESIVAVAAVTAGTNWRVESAAVAVAGFAAIAGVWWLYFDRQAGVVLRGTTASVVLYSYAHLPLLMALGATSAGLRLLIDGAGAQRLGWGASAALLGGIVVFLLALIATRSVTVAGPRRVGVSIKLATAAAILVLLAAQAALRPLVVAVALALVICGAVFAERTLTPARA
jgi:low temperature requirement protein LtrA